MNAPTLRLLATVAILALPGSSAAAQLPANLSAGQPVRFHAWSASYEGKLVGIQGDSLRLVRKVYAFDRQDTVAIALSAVSDLWVSTGRDRIPLKGMVTGLLVGAGIFGAMGAAMSTSCPQGSYFCFTGSDGLVIGLAFGGGVGAVLGLVIGAVTHQQRWEKLPLPLGVTVTPDGGAGMTLRLRTN